MSYHNHNYLSYIFLFLSIYLLYFPQPQQHIPHRSGTKFNLVQIKSSVGHPTYPSQPTFKSNPSAFVILKEVGIVGLYSFFLKMGFPKNFSPNFFNFFTHPTILSIPTIYLLENEILWKTTTKEQQNRPVQRYGRRLVKPFAVVSKATSRKAKYQIR